MNMKKNPKQLYNLKQRIPFSPTNSNWTRKCKSYTRNSFRVECRADLHFEHRNHETEHALCFASRSDSIKLYSSFYPCSQLCLWSARITHLYMQSLSYADISFIKNILKWCNTEIRWIYLFFFPLLFVFRHLAPAIFPFVLGNLLEFSLTD